MKAGMLVTAIALLATALPFSAAQAQVGRVMREDEVTESGLIEALTPEQIPEGAAARNRSFGVTGMEAPSPAKTASASLLITFGTNSAELTSRAKRSLDIVGKALNSDKLAEFRFEVEGHADPRGNPQSNMALSSRRAESVRRYLIESQNVRESRLEAIGKGSMELLNPGNPIAPENRRVTIVNLAQ